MIRVVWLFLASYHPTSDNRSVKRRSYAQEYWSRTRGRHASSALDSRGSEKWALLFLSKFVPVVSVQSSRIEKINRFD
jgi:hypothetical protein